MGGSFASENVVNHTLVINILYSRTVISVQWVVPLLLRTCQSHFGYKHTLFKNSYKCSMGGSFASKNVSITLWL